MYLVKNENNKWNVYYVSGYSSGLEESFCSREEAEDYLYDLGL